MSAYRDIEANDLFSMMATQPLMFVDVCNDDEVARGIISGVVQIPLAVRH